MLQKDHQAIDILLAEIDIYELFAFKHCKGRKVKLALCEGNLICRFWALFTNVCHFFHFSGRKKTLHFSNNIAFVYLS